MIYDKNDVLVGSAEAAHILGISQHTLRELSRRGKLPCIKRFDRWKYSVRVLEAIAEGRQIPHEYTPHLNKDDPTKDFSGDHHNKV